jgi:eukaryotic-like serine/threonine-protein kinase
VGIVEASFSNLRDLARTGPENGLAGVVMPMLSRVQAPVVAIEREPTLVSRSNSPGLGCDLNPGMRVGQNYRVEQLLGIGGMGTVFLAHDEVLDRPVAIKFVREPLLGEAFRARFVIEARAMARVRHPNVVQIHAFGEHLGCPYFVMEFVEGMTLDAWLKRQGGQPSLEQCVQLLDGICDAVSAIHAADTVHRDLKPSNIIIQSDLRPRVTDLGLAFFSRGEACDPREAVGTPAYMAPEVGLGISTAPELLARADVYSLGCVAYEMFAGRQPYRSESGCQLTVRHGRDPVPSLRDVRGDLPEELDLAVQHALAKAPLERTASPEAFRREIIRACGHSAEPDRILVAEDSDDFRDALDVTLKAAFRGADVECVSNGHAALEAFDRKCPSIVILDFHMPGLDGLELTRLFRARRASPNMPIIVLTAAGGSEEWGAFRAQGADRFLVKPVALEDVVALVARLSDRARSCNRPGTEVQPYTGITAQAP